MLLLLLEAAVIHGLLPALVPSHIPGLDLPAGGHGIVPAPHLLLRVMSVPLLTCLLPLGLHGKGPCDSGGLIGIVLRTYCLGEHQEKETVRLFL